MYFIRHRRLSVRQDHEDNEEGNGGHGNETSPLRATQAVRQVLQSHQGLRHCDYNARLKLSDNEICLIAREIIWEGTIRMREAQNGMVRGVQGLRSHSHALAIVA